jgi:hypothetical protein
LWNALGFPLQQNQLSRIFDWQGSQHDGVYEAEDCRIPTDAEGKREYGDSCESGILSHLPQRVAKVLE